MPRLRSFPHAPRHCLSTMPLGIVLVVCALLAPAAARAGPYMDEVRVQQACRSIGELGASAFQARPSTSGIMSRFELQQAARVWLQQMNTLHPIPEGREGRIIRATVMHAFTEAISPRDAYDYGWARCMDAYGPSPFGPARDHGPPSTGRLR